MFVLLESWKQSFFLLHPKTLLVMMRSAKSHFVQTLVDVVHFLKWVFVLDAAVFLLFGQKIFAIFDQAANKAQPMQALPFIVTIVGIIVSITTFLLHGAFLVVLRRQHSDLNRPIREYFGEYFMRYVQLALFFSLIMVVFFSLIMSLGITKIPTIQSWFPFLFRLIEMLMIFYWLDSKFTFKDVFGSLEKGLNLFFYNLPFFLLILGLFFLGLHAIDRIAHILPAINHEGAGMISSGLYAVGFRYGKMFLSFAWTAFLFVFYQRRNQVLYNKIFSE